MDRRQRSRIRTDCRLRTYREGRLREGRAYDLSTDGALVFQPTNRRPALVQRIELELDGGARFQALARTVWSQDGWHAVRFVGLSDADRLDIAEHLDRVMQARRAA
jgi:hypothetical protein